MNGYEWSRGEDGFMHPTPVAVAVVEKKTTVVWTDGSCLSNPGPGGWAWATEEGESDSGGARRATNNAMEMQAVIEALKAIDGDILVWCDSQYAINAFTVWAAGWKKNGWRTKGGSPVKNRELVEEFLRLSRNRRVEMRWVKGHSGDAMNERVDRMALAAAARA